MVMIFIPIYSFHTSRAAAGRADIHQKTLLLLFLKKNKKQPFLAALTDFPFFGKPVYRITCQINITESWLVLAQTKEDPSIIEMYQDKF